MKKRVLSLALAVILCLGLVPSALAYTTPDFSDVPQGHWAYEAVMKMADAGVIKGVGEGRFDPEGKLTAEMFVVLVGRVVFPDVKAEGADWSGPYIAEAKAKGLLEGTNITDSTLKGEISRYDMAAILAKCVEILKVSASKADSSKVADYGEVPAKYIDAVLMAYGSGLIRGDQAGSFNGQNSMTRQEAATVMDRLLGLKGSSHGETTDPEKPAETERPTESEKPVEDKLVEYRVHGYVEKTDHAIGRPVDDEHTYLKGIPLKLLYTPDGGETSTLVAETVAASDDIAHYDITFEAPESWGSYANYENGNGFYISAETVLDGQRLVTSDLRTDGRAYIDILYLRHGSTTYGVELTPPDGEKAKFTVTGYVVAGVNPDGSWPDANGYHPPGFTVQLFFKDGTLLGEAVTDSDGKFSIDCAIDALDGGFDRFQKLYYTKVSGYIRSDLYRENTIYPADGSPFLKSLVDLGVVPDLNLSTPLRLQLTVDKAESLDARQEAYNNKNK